MNIEISIQKHTFTPMTDSKYTTIIIRDGLNQKRMMIGEPYDMEVLGKAFIKFGEELQK